MYAEVLIDLALAGMDRTYIYEVPVELAPKIRVGMRVLVPLGRSHREGYVLRLTDKPGIVKLKRIIRVLDDEPVLTEEILKLAEWMAEYYLCSVSAVLKNIIPRSLKKKRKHCLVPLVDQAQGIELVQAFHNDRVLNLMVRLWEEGEVDLKEAYRILESEQLLRALEDKGLVVRSGGYKLYQPTLAEHVYELAPGFTSADLAYLRQRAPRQFEIVSCLHERGRVPAEELESRFPRSSLASLLGKGVITKKRAADSPAGQPLLPTFHQRNAIDAISSLVKSGRFSRCLLFGVTGSGKSEVYLQVVERVLASRKQVMVLVPEIALAQQMIRVFSARVGSRMAVLHSGLSDAERYEEYRRILKGEVDLVLGARSAVFAPVNNLGLIIIDEEQEYTFKQENFPRYHAREVAERRAQLQNAVLLLGSATPSVETFYKAQIGEYKLLELPERIGNNILPRIQVVDMRAEFRQGNRSVLSALLRKQIGERLDKGEQVILFLNRRGFFTFVMCRECGLVLTCPHCSIPLAYHRVTGRLHCHYCFSQIDNQETCPRCGSIYMRKLGVGTQKVEEEVLKTFPQARVARLDTDTTRRKDSHRQIVEAMARGDIDILVGTQMVAKGFDFHGVTLVGVILADTMLNLPDFRACERSFQLLLQAAGRAGRGSAPGEVVIQTYQPDNYAVKCVLQHDYASFYNYEIRFRESMGYPPFSRLVRIVVSSVIQREAEAAALELGRLMRELLSGRDESVEILGPGPCYLAKLRDRYRFQILLKGPDQGLLTSIGKYIIRYIIEKRKSSNVRIDIDVDPLFMM